MSSAMREMKPPEKGIQLLAEGKTAKYFLDGLVRHLKLPIEIQNFGGNPELPMKLRWFAGRPEFTAVVRSVGIVRDAELSPSAEQAAATAFQEVCTGLKQAGLPAPSVMGQVQEGTPRVGVFVLPDCQRAGMLETLCWEAIQGQPIVPCVETYLACVASKAGVDLRNRAKAAVWTYLAVKGLSDPQVGRAAQAGVWQWHDAAFQPLTRFLQQLSLDEKR